MGFVQPRVLRDGKTKRYDVRWLDPPDKKGRKKERRKSFKRRHDADDFLSQVVEPAELVGVIANNEGGSEVLESYANYWLSVRRVKGEHLAPKTVEGYRGLLARNVNHLWPEQTEALGRRQLRRITPEVVDEWYAAVATHASQDQAAKSYRLLRAILQTATLRDRITSNPCRIPGGGTEHAAERPMVQTETVLELAEVIDERYRALIYLASFGALRTGESLGLRRADVDPVQRTVQVLSQAQEISGQGRVTGDPKTDAGRRTVSLPKIAMDALEWHLARFTGPEPSAVVFTAPRGGPVARSRVSEAWIAAKAALEIDPELSLNPHDLRHFGATLAARKPGITLKELMAHIGHVSPRAALRYQKATLQRELEIGDYMDAAIASAERPEKARILRLVPDGRRHPDGIQPLVGGSRSARKASDQEL
jgi:integrase